MPQQRVVKPAGAGRGRHRAGLAALALAIPVAAVLGPADRAAAARPYVQTIVDRGVVVTEYFPDDICGPRGSTTTFTHRVQQSHLTEHPDGSFTYHDVSVFTYTADYDDPALPDLTGSATEVNHYTLTPSEGFLISTTYHDLVGDLRIFERVNLKIRPDGTLVVDRAVLDVTGCP